MLFLYTNEVFSIQLNQHASLVAEVFFYEAQGCGFGSQPLLLHSDDSEMEDLLVSCILAAV